MKHVKEKFELSEQDIKDAISHWVRFMYPSPIRDRDMKFDVTLKVERQDRPAPAGAPVGGMADYSVQVVIAVAEKL